MAVTKIRRLSNWILIVSTLVTAVVLGLFFFGGDGEPYNNGELWNPAYTSLLLNWIYILFALTIAATLVFAVWQFASKFKTNPRGAALGLTVIVLFAGLLYLTYAVGDVTPLPILNADAQVYNVPFWLKITDMWLFSTYILIGLVVIAILVGNVKRIIDK
ncbi:MAG: hypothetical protein LBQ39_00460 [Tannerellaceae bacterium]|jgi:hypothetical protein|nr:hypothetical protein [Tannerellaceae bacterium]